MSMWSLTRHFTNKSVTRAPYNLRHRRTRRTSAAAAAAAVTILKVTVTVCHTAEHYGEGYDD